MNLDEVKAFIKGVKWGYLATSDGKVVGCRPMAGYAWFGSEFRCATGRPTDKVAHLEKVPYAEYCFCDEQGRQVRMAGKCRIVTDNKVKKELYDAVPELKNYIEDPADEMYVVLAMRPDRIRYADMTDMEYTEIAIA